MEQYYHINCNKCNYDYWSDDGFPNFCPHCGKSFKEITTINNYNYRNEITNDIKNWLIENNWIHETYGDTTPDYFDLIDNLNDTLWAESSITGNGIEGFYDTEEKCEEYVCHNLTLYFEAAREFDDWPVMYDIDWIYKNPAQHMDCTIRCYLLGECIDRALEELNIISQLNS